jgi:hypothetical protein
LKKALSEVLVDPEVDPAIRVSIAIHLDPEGEYIDPSLVDVLEDELMELAYEADDADWEEYRYVEQLKSSYSSDHFWEYNDPSLPSFMAERIYEELREIVIIDSITTTRTAKTTS